MERRGAHRRAGRRRAADRRLRSARPGDTLRIVPAVRLAGAAPPARFPPRGQRDTGDND
ncbi:hypothetical protein [Streptomyces lavendofoliae]|uniref:Uncharacterized protein n=1 Tax=Streptomyces lavendofoliae TaxID=67314 RepID=A0A918M4F6_9ACTN|nr:hypothetical protein [Streptomyces lavendofoliae]GGU41239.1 hypothetical protein GCM10010274_31270 [Streptomyces lavendofoliae]